MSMKLRLFSGVTLAVLLLGAAWFILDPGEPTGGPTDGPGDGDVPNGNAHGGGEKPPPPPPGTKIVERLADRNGESARRELAELARTPDGVREIVGAMALSTSASDRALLCLHLVLGGTPEGLAHVREAATGQGREPDRIPALYALAAGEDADVATLAGLVSETTDEALFRAAVFALALRGDDGALRALEAALAGDLPLERRRLVYASLADGPSRPDEGFLSMLREKTPGLAGVDPTQPGYRRFVDRVAREDSPEMAPAAAELLLRLPGDEAQQGVVDLWQRAEGDSRNALTETILNHVRMDSGTGARTVITIGRGLGEEAQPHQRERIRQRLQEIQGDDALPDLREWRDAEADPETRHRLEELIRRLEEESGPR